MPELDSAHSQRAARDAAAIDSHAANASGPLLSATSRRALLWRLGSVCGLVVVGLLMPVAWRGRAATATFDLGHAPTFAVLAVVSLIVLTRIAGRLSRKSFMAVAALLVLSGGGLEYLQRFFRRSPSWGDALANTVGVACGLAWFLATTQTGRTKWLLRLAALVGMISICFQPASIIFDCYRFQRDFPLISSFEDRLELTRWHVRKGSLSVSSEFHTHGNYCLEWNLTPGRFPRMSQSDPADWSTCHALQFDALLSDSTTNTQKLNVKIFDLAHNFEFDDRFHAEFELTKGEPQTIRIDLADVKSAPTSREMDLSQIFVLEIFAIDQTEPARVLLDNVRLLK